MSKAPRGRGAFAQYRRQGAKMPRHHAKNAHGRLAVVVLHIWRPERAAREPLSRPRASMGEQEGQEDHWPPFRRPRRCLKAAKAAKTANVLVTFLTDMTLVTLLVPSRTSEG